MAIEGVSHFGLCVTDVEAAERFYCDVLGFRLARPTSRTTSDMVRDLLELDELEMTLTFVERDGVRLELINFSRPQAVGGGKPPFNRVGFTHLSLKIRDWENELDRLRAAGVNVLEQTIGAQESSNARFAFILDPDGNRVELFGLVDEDGHKPWDFD